MSNFGKNMKNYMGIDIGTSGCKAAIFGEEGKQLVLAYREYDVISPQDGWAELDSNEVIEKCFDVICEATSQVEPYSVCALGISSQGEAFTVIDEEGKALYNALVSSDIRADEYSKNWAKEFGERKLYEITGHTPHPMFSLFKLLWMKHNIKLFDYAHHPSAIAGDMDADGRSFQGPFGVSLLRDTERAARYCGCCVERYPERGD